MTNKKSTVRDTIFLWVRKNAKKHGKTITKTLPYYDYDRIRRAMRLTYKDIASFEKLDQQDGVCTFKITIL